MFIIIIFFKYFFIKNPKVEAFGAGPVREVVGEIASVQRMENYFPCVVTTPRENPARTARSARNIGAARSRESGRNEDARGGVEVVDD